MNQFRTAWLRFAIQLLIACSLFWISEEFSFGRLFKPDSIGWKVSFSYAKDLMQPFALYYFLCLGGRWLKTWQARAAVAFGIPLVLELFQLFYHQVAPTLYIGSFDPLDILVYATGVALAVLLDQWVITKSFQSMDSTSLENL